MYRGNNPSALASRKLILDTLKELLAEKPFKDISIKELCSRSGVSRQTFYAHFGTKENIILFWLEGLYRVVHAPEEECGIPLWLGCQRIGMFVLENYDLMRMLVKNDLIELLETAMYRVCVMHPFCLPKLEHQERKYGVRFLCAGACRVLEIYIREHEVPEASELLEQLFNTMSGSIFQDS